MKDSSLFPFLMGFGKNLLSLGAPPSK